MADRGISPRVTDAVDLGSASKSWRKLYAGRIDEGTYIPGAFNKKETFTTSGTFTAPVTGVYRITLQGGGGGGAGAGTSKYQNVMMSGGGGGQGGHLEFYEKLTSGVSYSYTVGTGGAGGTAGSTTAASGGSGSHGTGTTISINGHSYEGGAGQRGRGGDYYSLGGNGGLCKIDDVVVGRGVPGSGGSPGLGATGGCGGGNGGASHGEVTPAFGGGGGGGRLAVETSSPYLAGSAGADGYISFEYYEVSS